MNKLLISSNGVNNFVNKVHRVDVKSLLYSSIFVIRTTHSTIMLGTILKKRLSDNQVVMQSDAQRLCGGVDLVGHGDVGFRRCGIAG